MSNKFTSVALDQKDVSGLTLIELLVVVSIIAILAGIAIANFLTAQVRSKVARAKTDIRTIAIGIEAYAIDNNSYPRNDGNYNVVPIPLTTPIAYLSTAALRDPFTANQLHPVHGNLVQFYTYQNIIALDEVSDHIATGNTPPVEAIDGAGYNPGAIRRYGIWKLVSNGPDGVYSQFGVPAGAWNPNPLSLMGADIPYDPTNGSISPGNIHRTQKHVGLIPPF